MFFLYTNDDMTGMCTVRVNIYFFAQPPVFISPCTFHGSMLGAT